MSMIKKDIVEWLETISGNETEIGIDDDGLRLLVNGGSDKGCYLEIGGVDDFEIIGPGDDIDRISCSFCHKIFEPFEEKINTCTINTSVTLCRKCYDNSSFVR